MIHRLLEILFFYNNSFDCNAVCLQSNNVWLVYYYHDLWLITMCQIPNQELSHSETTIKVESETIITRVEVEFPIIVEVLPFVTDVHSIEGADKPSLPQATHLSLMGELAFTSLSFEDNSITTSADSAGMMNYSLTLYQSFALP